MLSRNILWCMVSIILDMKASGDWAAISYQIGKMDKMCVIHNMTPLKWSEKYFYIYVYGGSTNEYIHYRCQLIVRLLRTRKCQ